MQDPNQINAELTRLRDIVRQNTQAPSFEISLTIYAIQQLGRFRDQESVPVLLECSRRHCRVDVKWAAVDALGDIGDPAALPYLIEALNSTGLVLPCRAATALGKIGTPEAIEALEQVIKSGGRCTSMFDRRYGEPDVVIVAKEALRDHAAAREAGADAAS